MHCSRDQEINIWAIYTTSTLLGLLRALRDVRLYLLRNILIMYLVTEEAVPTGPLPAGRGYRNALV